MIESVAIAPTVEEAPAAKSGKFQAGVRPYAQDYCVPDYVPTDTDLLCAFRIKPAPSTDMTEASAAVASGGIHVMNIPDLYSIYGNDCYMLFGGGTHGHPRGSRAGARANRVATEAIVAGKTLDEAAKDCSELCEAMELWGNIKFQVSA